MNKFYVTLFLMLFFASNGYSCEGLIFSGAWVREPPPVASVAAGYVSITNTTKSEIVIKSFDSDCCAHLMAHETVVEETKTKMKHLSELTIPANQTIKLEPLGKHLMLIKPTHAISSGEYLNVNFHCPLQGSSTDNSSAVAFPIVKK